MTAKRLVSCSFWSDEKVKKFSAEDKYFFLYLLTNEHATTVGIYALDPQIAGLELGYSTESVNVLLDRFESLYGIILRSEETNEIAVKNYLKYSVTKGGKPMYDALMSSAKAVSDRNLVKRTFEALRECSEISFTVSEVIDCYLDEMKEIGDESGVLFADVVSEKDLNGGEKIQYAEYVKMTQKQYDALLKRLGSDDAVMWCINKLNHHKKHNKTSYKDDYRGILKWVIDAYNKQGKQKFNDALSAREELDRKMREAGING